MFPVKAIEIFAGIVSVKVNHESIVDRRGSKALFLLKMNLKQTYKEGRF